jgi:hypothetical protein
MNITHRVRAFALSPLRIRGVYSAPRAQLFPLPSGERARGRGAMEARSWPRNQSTHAVRPHSTTFAESLPEPIEVSPEGVAGTSAATLGRGSPGL